MTWKDRALLWMRIAAVASASNAVRNALHDDWIGAALWAAMLLYCIASHVVRSRQPEGEAGHAVD